MALKLITPPEPIFTPEDAIARLHLKVDSDYDNELIAFYIAAATKAIDGDTWFGRALKPQSYELVFDGFPAGAIEIPIRPLIEIESVKYDDEDGVEQTVDTDDYIVDTVSDPAWVVPAADFSWPATLDGINAMRVRFTAGYPDTEDSPPGTTVPEDIQAAILLNVGTLYAQRETIGTSSMADVQALMSAKNLLAGRRVFR